MLQASEKWKWLEILFSIKRKFYSDRMAINPKTIRVNLCRSERLTPLALLFPAHHIKQKPIWNKETNSMLKFVSIFPMNMHPACIGWRQVHSIMTQHTVCFRKSQIGTNAVGSKLNRRVTQTVSAKLKTMGHWSCRLISIYKLRCCTWCTLSEVKSKLINRTCASCNKRFRIGVCYFFNVKSI